MVHDYHSAVSYISINGIIMVNNTRCLPCVVSRDLISMPRDITQSGANTYTPCNHHRARALEALRGQRCQCHFRLFVAPFHLLSDLLGAAVIVLRDPPSRMDVCLGDGHRGDTKDLGLALSATLLSCHRQW